MSVVPKKLEQARSFLLAEVNREVTLRLLQNLRDIAPISLHKDFQPEQVYRRWDPYVKLDKKASPSFSVRGEALDIFNSPEVQGLLLILGEPGAGKTTFLLELASSLTQKSSGATAAAPIPVVLSLSSYRPSHQTIKDWLIAELSSKYGVRSSLGHKLIEEKQILPLLDGLDELPSENQPQCVTEINRFLESEYRSFSLVVCSRREEYESYSEKLNLHGAVFINKLTSTQVENCLVEANKEALWKELLQEPSLLELIKTPLLLYIFTMSYSESLSSQLKEVSREKDRLHLILEVYVERMLTRNIESVAYDEKCFPSDYSTVSWLSVLARHLNSESSTELLIENIEVLSLPEEVKNSVNGLTNFLIFLLLYVLPLSALSTLPYLYYGTSGILFGGALSVVMAVFIGYLTKTLRGEADGLVEKLEWSWRKVSNIFWALFSVGIMLGAIGGLCSGIVGDFMSPGVSESYVFGIGHCISMALFPLGIWLTSNSDSSSRGILPVTGSKWLNTCLGSLLFGAVFGVIIGLVVDFSSGWFSQLTHFISLGLFHNLSDGILPVFESLLCFGLVWAVTLSLFALMSGLEVSELDSKLIPNQGIWISLKNSIKLGCFGIFIVGLLSICIFGLKLGSVFSLIGGLIAALLGGISICIRHLALRFSLCLKGYAPYNYTRFLDYSTERLLLQRVGGRYRFIHKFLQDYFADSDISNKYQNQQKS